MIIPHAHFQRVCVHLFQPLKINLQQQQHPLSSPYSFQNLSLSLSWVGVCGYASLRVRLIFWLAVAGPNMEAITASLERSLQNCSLNNRNHNHRSRREQQGSSVTDADADAGIGISSSSDDVPDNNHIIHDFSNSDTTLELNSHISLPYHWEQCLDLKTGEIYYINWRNGMKAKEDPRRVASGGEYSNSTSRDYESEEEEEEESWYDSEESSSESCPSSSKGGHHHQLDKQNNSSTNNNNTNNNVLVVAGCKSCLMYFMVPKQVEDCPKCSGQLLHFDRSENGSP